VGRFVLFLALRHIRRRPLQSGLTILGVAVGVMVLITALSLTNGFIDELIESTLRATPHLSLQTFRAGDTVADDRDLLAALLDHPEVAAVAPVLITQALIARRANTTLGISGVQGFSQIVGIDPALEAAVLDLPQLAGLGDAVSGGIVLGASLAAQTGILPGDDVIIQNIGSDRATLTVTDTFRVGNELIDAITSYTDLATMQRYLDVEGEISGYHVRLKRPERAAELAAQLGQLVGLQPISWERLFSTLVDQLRLQKAVISAVVFLIVLVAALGIANILILTVSEKTQEIAIVRALGASERQILQLFTLEGLILGGGGTLLGALLGFAVSTYFRVQPFPLPGDLYFITQLPVELQLFDFLWVCGLSIGTSVLAGLLPARRASRLRPVEVLR
jgi:lipoprotein-releasing system permease protein